MAGGDVRLRHYRVKSMVTRARLFAGVWSALSLPFFLDYGAVYNVDHAMPLVYDDLFLICQEEVRLHSFLRDRGLLGDFTNLLCDLCGEGFIRLRRDRSFSRNGFVWRCSRTGKCHKKFSIRANSWFEKSKLDILTILKLTFYWLNRCTNEFVQNQLILGSKHTVVDWFNFAREVCATILFQTNEVLGGEGKVVEIDESKFGKRKYNRGRRVDGCWVFGGVERDSDKSFL